MSDQSRGGKGGRTSKLIIFILYPFIPFFLVQRYDHGMGWSRCRSMPIRLSSRHHSEYFRNSTSPRNDRYKITHASTIAVLFASRFLSIVIISCVSLHFRSKWDDFEAVWVHRAIE